jgi:transcriptional regulator with XRE-family HTH domain
MLREQIISARKEQGYTQSSLARKIGVRQATINEFESGKRGLRFEILEKIFNELNLVVMNVQQRKKMQLEKSAEIATLLIKKGVKSVKDMSKKQLVDLTQDSYLSTLPTYADKEYRSEKEKESDENVFEYFLTLLEFDIAYQLR